MRSKFALRFERVFCNNRRRSICSNALLGVGCFSGHRICFRSANPAQVIARGQEDILVSLGGRSFLPDVSAPDATHPTERPYRGSDPQLFVCWLSAAICEGIVLICKANVFIRSVAVRVCSLRDLVCFFAVLVRPVTGFIRRGFISRISTLSRRRFTLAVWISPNRQFTTSRIRRAG